MQYIQSLEVVYDDNKDAVDGEDINRGFGGRYVYFRPIYTTDRTAAAVGFSIVATKIHDNNANDFSSGDGKELWRYLQVHYRPDGSMRPIEKVYLTEQRMGDGNTGDLNRGRGGRYLYLCWTFAK